MSFNVIIKGFKSAGKLIAQGFGQGIAGTFVNLCNIEDEPYIALNLIDEAFISLNLSTEG